MKRTTMAAVLWIVWSVCGCAVSMKDAPRHLPSDPMLSVDEWDDEQLAELARSQLGVGRSIESMSFQRVELPTRSVTHPKDVVIVIVGGNGTLRVGSANYTVSRGSIVTVPAELAYGIEGSTTVDALVVTRGATVTSKRRGLVASRRRP